MTQQHEQHFPRSTCPVDQLEWFVNHTLSAPEQAAIEAHLAGCASCQAEVRNWRELRQALQAASTYTPVPRADLFLQIEQRLDLCPSPAPWLRWKLLAQACWLGLMVCGEHVWAQARLLRRELFWLPLLFVPLSCLVVYLPAWQHSPGPAALLTALFTALCMAFLYGQEVDPAREMTLVTRTSPRLVLGMRCCLVFGYNLLLNCGLMLPFLAAQGMVTPVWFLANWLAPLCCLSAIALLLSVLVNSGTAVVVCLVLWGLRVLNGMQVLLTGGPQPLWQVSGFQQYEQFWHQGPLLCAVAVLTLVLTFLLLERRERFAR